MYKIISRKKKKMNKLFLVILFCLAATCYSTCVSTCNSGYTWGYVAGYGAYECTCEPQYTINNKCIICATGFGYIITDPWEPTNGTCASLYTSAQCNT